MIKVWSVLSHLAALTDRFPTIGKIIPGMSRRIKRKKITAPAEQEKKND